LGRDASDSERVRIVTQLLSDGFLHRRQRAAERTRRRCKVSGGGVPGPSPPLARPFTAELNLRTAKAILGPKWIPWVLAPKTTPSALLALLVAFTFNLDQPYWALLTVFVVSQPLQSGQVLAKSVYRVIGTLIGAAVALLFVALFAQERVLFLG